MRVDSETEMTIDDMAALAGLGSVREIQLESGLYLLRHYLEFYCIELTDNPVTMLNLSVIELQAMQDEGGYCCHLEEEIDHYIDTVQTYGVWNLL